MLSPVRSSRLLYCATVVLLQLSPAGGAAALQDADTLVGTVQLDRRPAVGATVSVTSLRSRATVSGSTDSVGAFRLVISPRAAPYALIVQYRGAERSVTRVDSVPGAGTLRRDIALVPLDPLAIDPVVVVARPRPRRTTGALADVPTIGDPLNPVVSGVVGVLPPELAGDVGALAAAQIGIGPGGGSLGLSAEHAQTALNGLAADGVSLPAGLATSVRFFTSPYDPFRGGFTGMQTAVGISAGGDMHYAGLAASVDGSAITARRGVAGSVGQGFGWANASLAGRGPLSGRTWAYNGAVHARIQSFADVTFAGASDDALVRYGVAPDSARRLVTAAEGFGVPARLRADRTATSASVTVAARIDYRPASPGRAGDVPPSRSMLFVLASHSEADARSQPMTIGVATPRAIASNALVQVAWSGYVGPARAWLNDLSGGVAIRRQSITGSNASRPGAGIRIASGLSDSVPSIRTVRLGELTNGGVELETRSAEVREELTWLPARGGTPRRILLQSRLESATRFDRGLAVGWYEFGSIAKFEANQPDAFSRRVASASASVNQWSGAAAFASRKTGLGGRLELEGGLRLDAFALLSGVGAHAGADSTFGIRTDVRPAFGSVSPRLGFRLGPPRASGPLGAAMPVGLVPVWEGVLGGAQGLPSGVFSGGIGLFAGGVPVSGRVGAAAQRNTALTLHCVGDEVPVPEWSGWQHGTAELPAACDGTISPLSGSSAVHYFARDYSGPRSLRSSVSYTRSVSIGGLRLQTAVTGVYALHDRLGSALDVNLVPAPAFRLARERDRPVYVSPERIEATSGYAPLGASRVNPAFSRVIEQRSDTRSEARQFGVTVQPGAMLANEWMLLFGYTTLDVRTRSRGFDGTTDGDPRDRTWGSPLWTPNRHRFVVHAGRSIGRVGITAWMSFEGGARFTPVVGGDINGDGLANDRAYVFTAGDGSVEGMATSALAAGAPRRVRDCLRKQAASLARPASCPGAWAATANARIDFWQPLPLGAREARVSVNLANPLAALDALFHGSAGLKGWGSIQQPDPVLYYVRGFDAGLNQYRYDVNSRFGRVHERRVAEFNPFRVAIVVSIDLAEPERVQAFRRSLIGDSAGVRNRLSAAALVARLSLQLIDPVAPLLVRADSLRLEDGQLTSLARIQREFQTFGTTSIERLSSHLASLPERYDAAKALVLHDATMGAITRALREARGRAITVLTAEQVALLPPLVRAAYPGN